MAHEDALMVEFALKWLPYGGGDEHILPEFGLTPTEFYLRIMKLMNSLSATRVDLGPRLQLIELCSLKLAHEGTKRRPREKESMSGRTDQPFEHRRRAK